MNQLEKRKLWSEFASVTQVPDDEKPYLTGEQTDEYFAYAYRLRGRAPESYPFVPSDYVRSRKIFFDILRTLKGEEDALMQFRKIIGEVQTKSLLSNIPTLIVYGNYTDTHLMIHYYTYHRYSFPDLDDLTRILRRLR